MLSSLSTRDQFTSPKSGRDLNPSTSLNDKNIKQCYVEEQTRVLDSFMIQAYNVLKSLVRRLKQFMAFNEEF